MVDKGLKKHTIRCAHLEEIDQVARKIIKNAGNNKVWLFEGEMGAGKTTLIKAICEAFGVVDLVNSPTFSIVNEYRNEQDDIFYHFDFYRLKDITEAIDIGAEEYFDSGDYCFIEWPSKVEQILPEEVLRVNVTIEGKDERLVELIRYE